MYLYKRGFTLAEVLITLTILGVVAAITVPSVIQNYKKRVTITKLQKAYSTLEVAAQNIAMNTGCVGRDVKCALDKMGISETVSSSGTVDNIILWKIFSKNAQFKSTSQISYQTIYQLYCEKKECSSSLREGRDYFTYGYASNSDQLKYVVSVGSLRISDTKTGLGFLVSVITDSSKNAKLIKGRNYFTFMIYDTFKVEPIKYCFGQAVCPASYNGSRASYTIDERCSPDVEVYSSGGSCAARIIRDGWKMKY